MTDLIARLAAAETGSEELDVAITREICHYGKNHPLWFTASYTRSIDAALTLVPEGWGWLVEVWQREESWAQVVRRPEGSTKPSGIFEGAEAKTPAIAITIAALKAKQTDA